MEGGSLHSPTQKTQVIVQYCAGGQIATSKTCSEEIFLTVIRECNAPPKITRRTGPVRKLNFVQMSGDS